MAAELEQRAEDGSQPSGSFRFVHDELKRVRLGNFHRRTKSHEDAFQGIELVGDVARLRHRIADMRLDLAHRVGRYFRRQERSQRSLEHVEISAHARLAALTESHTSLPAAFISRSILPVNA